MRPIRCIDPDSTSSFPNCPSPAYKVTKTQTVNDLGYYDDGKGNKTPMEEGYWVVGKFADIPEVGKPFFLVRLIRCGTPSMGEFTSTPIVAITKGENEITFHTHNSVYRVEEYLEQLPEFD